MVELKSLDSNEAVNAKVESLEMLRKMSPVRFGCKKDMILEVLEGIPHEEFSNLSREQVQMIKEKLDI